MVGVVIQVIAILFTALHPLGLIASFIYAQFIKEDRGGRGRIALPPDEPGYGSISANAHGRGEGEEERPPREIDPEAVWSRSGN
jgi:hypothetical protein